MATAAATVDPGLEAALQTTCEAVDALSVAVLDEKQPERDWHRWMQALFDAVATRPGISRLYGVRGGSFRRSMHGQRPGTDGRGPPSQSEHQRQSISSPRSLRFAAWSLAAPLAGGPGMSASS